MLTFCDAKQAVARVLMVRARDLSRAVLDRIATAASCTGFLLVRLVLLPALALFPARLAFSAARWRGRRRFRKCSPEMKNRMRRDLRLVFGPKEEARIDAVLEESAEIVSCDELDVFCYARFGSRGFSRIVQVEGLEHLDAALKGGRGALLFSGHFGGAQGFLGVLAGRGYRLFGVLRAFDQDPWIHRLNFAWKSWVLERVQNGPLLYAGKGPLGHQALRHLREGRVGWILIDATPRSTRRVAEVEFLGRPCRLAYGVIELAEMTGAPVLPFFVFYTAPHLRRAVIGEPVEFVTHSDPLVARTMNLRRCLERIEEAVSLAPSHWMLWGHFESLWSTEAAVAEVPAASS